MGECDLGANHTSAAMLAREMPEDRWETLKAEAWIGDAVLELFTRERILRESGVVDGAAAIRMTSNQFLSGLGEPTEVEAQIGRVYQGEGLVAAFAWIERELMPLFARQEAKRQRRR